MGQRWAEATTQLDGCFPALRAPTHPTTPSLPHHPHHRTTHTTPPPPPTWVCGHGCDRQAGAVGAPPQQVGPAVHVPLGGTQLGLGEGGGGHTLRRGRAGEAVRVCKRWGAMFFCEKRGGEMRLGEVGGRVWV